MSVRVEDLLAQGTARKCFHHFFGGTRRPLHAKQVMCVEEKALGNHKLVDGDTQLQDENQDDDEEKITTKVDANGI